MIKKKFKLVYEKDGILKGSNTGIPADTDTDLIERAVLEGSKPVPAPGPGDELTPEAQEELIGGEY